MHQSSVSRQVKLTNNLGFHARLVTAFAKCAQRFPCEVRVTRGEQTADGRSVFQLMMLAAVRGSELTIEVIGDDAQSALDELCGLVTDWHDGE